MALCPLLSFSAARGVLAGLVSCGVALLSTTVFSSTADFDSPLGARVRPSSLLLSGPGACGCGCVVMVGELAPFQGMSVIGWPEPHGVRGSRLAGVSAGRLISHTSAALQQCARHAFGPLSQHAGRGALARVERGALVCRTKSIWAQNLLHGKAIVEPRITMCRLGQVLGMLCVGRGSRHNNWLAQKRRVLRSAGTGHHGVVSMLAPVLPLPLCVLPSCAHPW